MIKNFIFFKNIFSKVLLYRIENKLQKNPMTLKYFLIIFLWRMRKYILNSVGSITFFMLLYAKIILVYFYHYT